MARSYRTNDQDSLKVLASRYRSRLPHALAALALAALFATVPYWIIFGDAAANGRSETAEFFRYFLASLAGVVLIGVPIGLTCVVLLSRNGALSAKSLLVSGLLIPIALGLALTIGTGWFGVLFMPGLLIAGAVMAVTYWFWVLVPVERTGQ